MKVHKITADRIFFVMDSGAYGSIAREDAVKLQIAAKLPEGFIDGRRGGCLVDEAVAAAKEKKIEPVSHDGSALRPLEDKQDVS